MKLITKQEMNTLISNHGKEDCPPVVKLFTPDAACVWLLCSVDPENPDIAWGLCDLGLGFPELGSVSLKELATVRGQFGLPIERDAWFSSQGCISVYATSSATHQRIVSPSGDPI